MAASERGSHCTALAALLGELSPTTGGLHAPHSQHEARMPTPHPHPSPANSLSERRSGLQREQRTFSVKFTLHSLATRPTEVEKHVRAL